MPKGDAARNELALRERQLEHHDHLKRNSSHPDHGWKLPSKEDLKERIANLKKALEKAKAKQGGTRRRRRGGNPKFRTQKSPYLTYDKHLSEADAAKEAAQAEEDRQHANETRKKYMALAEKPFSRIADGHSIYTQYRLRVASTRRKAKGLPN
jgi:hypothetical protein